MFGADPDDFQGIRAQAPGRHRCLNISRTGSWNILLIFIAFFFNIITPLHFRAFCPIIASICGVISWSWSCKYTGIAPVFVYLRCNELMM
jgi:hypothetical protein